MRTHRLWRVLGFATVLSVVLAACAAPMLAPPTAVPTTAPTEAPAATGHRLPEPLSPPETVKVAYVPIIHFAPLYVAKERGFFEKLGLNVELERVKSGTEAIAFLTSGQLDVGAIAVSASAWNAFNKGMDLRVVAPAGLKRLKDDPTMLLVRTDLYESGEVTKPADLKGRTVAMAGGPGGGGEYLVSKALEGSGITVHDVNMVKVGNADMPAAFENKAIDAGLLGAPYAEQVLQAGTAKVLVKDMAPGAMTVVYVYSGKFMKERPEAAKRFMVAMMQAVRAMQGDDYLSDENLAAYLAYVKSTADAIRKGVPMIYDPEMKIDLDSLRDVERVHRENGRTDYTEPVDMSKVVDSSWRDYALSVLGPYQP